MKIRKIILTFFLIWQSLLHLFIITNLTSMNNTIPNFSTPNNFFIPLESNRAPSAYYENYFSNYNWEFDPNFAPLQILTVVHYDESSNIDDFAYLSAIPSIIFNDDGIRKISPIIYDNVINHTNTLDFLHEWKRYNDFFGGLKRVIYIGDVSDETRNEINNIFGSSGQVGSPINFSGNNIFDLSNQISDYFWHKADKAVLVLGNDTFDEPVSTTSYSINGNLGPNSYDSKIGTINSSNLEDIFTTSNLTLDGGAIFACINDTNNKLAIDLIGNYSTPYPWVFDTDNSTNNNFVFFPNVSYPANLSDWAIRVYNSSPLLSNVSYNITFCSFNGSSHIIPVNYSNTELRIDINWTNPSADFDIWLLDPSGQLIESSNRNGYLYEPGFTNESIAINYPALGNWKVIVTSNENNSLVDFTLDIKFSNHSEFKMRCVESATNGAVIASLLHIPIFFTDGTTLSTNTKNTILELKSRGLSEMIVVEPGNTINETLITELGISTVTTLENLSIIWDRIQGISSQNDFTLTSLEGGFFAPAGLISAYHGGIVLPIFNETFNFYSNALKNYKLMEYSYFQTPLSGPGPIYEDMTNLSDSFHNWLDNYDAGGTNRTIITVSHVSELNPIFERAIIGRSFPGRFSGENEIDNAIYICRNILYPALAFKNITNFNDPKNNIYQPYTRDEFWAGSSESINGINTKGNWLPFFDIFVKDFDIYYDNCSLNDSNGEILRPYTIKLKDQGIDPDNITTIDIKLVAKIGYSDSNIQSAGFKIWNWTSLDFVTINNSIFNSTDYSSGICSITNTNKTHFISSKANDSRIEIFFYANTTGLDLSARVNLVQFNVSFWTLFARQNMLSSSISYWHNFTFNSQNYNYTEEIPNIFSNFGYIINYSTNISKIINNFEDRVSLWYLCGLGNLSDNNFNDNGTFKLMTNDYWRGFDIGQNPEDPIGDGNPVDPTSGNEQWITGDELSNLLVNKSLNLTHIILNNDYLGSTKMPNILLNHGASLIIANLRSNMLGYSENLFYKYIQELLKNKSASVALVEGLNQTSHLYSKHWKGNIAESAPFPSNTEDYHQFIIFGDPELFLTNITPRLLLPGNYKPIALGFYDKSTRKGISPFAEEDFTSNLFANITDIDTKLNELDIDTTVEVIEYNYIDSTMGSYPINGDLYNIWTTIQFSHQAPLGPPVTINWEIDDQINSLSFSSIVYLETNSPFTRQFDDPRSHFYIDYGNGSDPVDMDFTKNYTIGRVNETLNASIIIQDTDHNNVTSFLDDSMEFNVTLHLVHKSSGIWVKNLTTYLSKTTGEIGDPWRWWYGYSQWNTSYIFTDDDPIGDYEFYVTAVDENGGNNLTKIDFSGKSPEVTNWLPEFDSFVNNTNSLFRVNETLYINATFFDRDDYLDENFSRYKENDSIILNCEGNNTITSNNIIGSYFENDYQATFLDDNFSHVIVNDSSGIIRVPYSINLTNAAIEYDNITEIEIKLEANLNNTENITFAGWKIYNWTSQSLQNIFNSTNKTIGVFYISRNNLSNFVNQSNRIEIFFYLETNTTTNASIDYIEFNVTYPVTKTGISAEIQMYNPYDIGSWINCSMSYDKVREIWQFDWVFTPENDSGSWFIYFNLTDKENQWKVRNVGKNITVKNHAPNWVSKNISTNSSYRGNSIEFYGNATDLDVFNRSEDLTLIACLYHEKLNKWDNNTYLTYNNLTNGWNATLLLNSSFVLGNWSFLVKVRDKYGGYNETNMTYFQVLNNAPVIMITKFYPSDSKLYDGEDILIKGNLSDVEYLNYSYIQINDSSGNSLRIPIYFPYKSNNATFIKIITKNNYRILQFSGTWKLFIIVADGDDTITNVSYILKPQMPPILPPSPPFSWDFLIIAGLIVTIVLGTILVYRFYRRERVVVPASRVKAIITKMVKEKEIEEMEEKKLIEERLKKEKLKKRPSKKIKKVKPVSKEKLEAKKEKLDKLEIKNLEVRLSETLNSARQAIRKKNFTYAAELYQRAAKTSSKLGDLEKAKRFSERAEELYKRGKKKIS